MSKVLSWAYRGCEYFWEKAIGKLLKTINCTIKSVDIAIHPNEYHHGIKIIIWNSCSNLANMGFSFNRNWKIIEWKKRKK